MWIVSWLCRKFLWGIWLLLAWVVESTSKGVKKEVPTSGRDADWSSKAVGCKVVWLNGRAYASRFPFFLL